MSLSRSPSRSLSCSLSINTLVCLFVQGNNIAGFRAPPHQQHLVYLCAHVFGVGEVGDTFPDRKLQVQYSGECKLEIVHEG